jgi:hypothetical protein
MAIRQEWNQQSVKRVNSEWRQVIAIAKNPASSQAERIGALIVAYRALEHVVSTTIPGGDATGRKLTALRGIIPDYMEIARAKDIRDRVAHHPVRVRHKELLFALLEYQRVLEALGVVLEEKIGREVIQKNGAPMLRRYLTEAL